MLLRAHHYVTGELIDVVCQGDSIQSIHPAGRQPADFTAPWIAPALFDLQINGCGGHSFNAPNLTKSGIAQVVSTCRRHGIGAFFPTLVTASFEHLHHGFSTLRQACADDPALDRAMPGFHLEGPYISAEDGPRGAHPRQHVRRPDWDEFRRLQDAAGGRIRLVTLAPEQEGALPFIEKLTKADLVVALGHTAATPEQIRAGVAAGAKMSTHLGNGSHALLPRHENYFLEQMANDDLWASIITDGHHLPPALVKILVRAKTAARMVLTCDASSLAGMPPGTYRQWGQEFEIKPEGKVVVPGTSFLAGSWAFTDLCVGYVMRFAGVTLAEAVDMAGRQPRKLLGLPERRLAAGQAADLILLDVAPGGGIQIQKTIVAGKDSIECHQAH